MLEPPRKPGRFKKTRKVTLRGPERVITVKASQDVDLSQIKVGDQVRVNYVEEFAIAVEPAPVKKGPGFNKKN